MGRVAREGQEGPRYSLLLLEKKYILAGTLKRFPRTTGGSEGFPRGTQGPEGFSNPLRGPDVPLRALSTCPAKGPFGAHKSLLELFGAPRAPQAIQGAKGVRGLPRPRG